MSQSARAAGRDLAPSRVSQPDPAVEMPRREPVEPGNQALLRLWRSGRLQPKLAVSQPGDELEKEADAIATAVVQSQPATTPLGGPRAQAVLAGALEKHRKKEEDPDRKVHAKAAVAPRRASSAVEELAAVPGTHGAPLGPADRGYFEQRLGRDLSAVRVHSDAGAWDAAASIGARAFTVGPDIYFGRGEYQSATSSGRWLLAHELAHTLQQAARPAGPDRASGPPVSPSPVMAARQAESAEPDSAEPPEAASEAAPAGEAAPPSPPADPIHLEGTAGIPDSPELAAWVESQRGGAEVPVVFGALARGSIRLIRNRQGQYETKGSGYVGVPIVHPVLEPVRALGAQPTLAIRIKKGVVAGYVTLARAKGGVGDVTELLEWIQKNTDALGLLGFQLQKVPRPPSNQVVDGALRLEVPEIPFRLAEFLRGSAKLGLVNDTLTFDAQTTIKIGGLGESSFEVHRDKDGVLAGHADLPVTFANFAGSLSADYLDGTVDIKGAIKYETEKLTGQVTLVVTDSATARDLALAQLGPEAVVTAAEETKGAPAKGKSPKPGPRAVAGWGTLDFRLTPWLTGRAQVIIDGEGHVTLVGEITPPERIELFAQRDYIKPLFEFEVRAAYGVPVVGNIFVYASLGMSALAKLGPGTLYDIRIQGTYSTDPEVSDQFSIQGTLNISAFAGLKGRAEGGAGIRIVKHDIKAGVGVDLLGGVRGYVEATPTVGYREKEDPTAGKMGEFFIKGHLEIAAQPFLGLSGDLFVKLDSPWWSPAPDKTWKWPLGELEYPLPGEFGIGADLEYVLGSNELPEIQFGEVDFNSERFLTDLIDDHVPPKKSTDAEKQGTWAEEPVVTGAAEPQVADTAGAPKKEGPAHGGGQAAPAPEDTVKEVGMAQPAVVKAAALQDLMERLQDSPPHTPADLDSAMEATYREFQPQGLKALDLDVIDESSMSLDLLAAASEVQRRRIKWNEVFAEATPGKMLFREPPWNETYAAISVNGELVGDMVASNQAGHAEANLIATHWDEAIKKVSEKPPIGTHHRLIVIVNRAPCSTDPEDPESKGCCERLIEAIDAVRKSKKAVFEQTEFILAPTHTYEPRRNLTPEEREAARKRYAAATKLLGAAAESVKGYTVIEKSEYKATVTKAADLRRLSQAGWDIRQLAMRSDPTSAQTILAEFAHTLAVEAGRAHAGK